MVLKLPTAKVSLVGLESLTQGPSSNHNVSFSPMKRDFVGRLDQTRFAGNQVHRLNDWFSTRLEEKWEVTSSPRCHTTTHSSFNPRKLSLKLNGAVKVQSSPGFSLGSSSGRSCSRLLASFLMAPLKLPLSSPTHPPPPPPPAAASQSHVRLAVVFEQLIHFTVSIHLLAAASSVSSQTCSTFFLFSSI